MLHKCVAATRVRATTPKCLIEVYAVRCVMLPLPLPLSCCPSATLKHKRKLIFPLLCFRIAVCVLCASQRSAKLPKIFSVLYIGINYVRVFLCVCVRLCVSVCACLCVYNWVLLRLCVVCIVLTLLLELICSSNTSKGSHKGSPHSSLWGLLIPSLGSQLASRLFWGPRTNGFYKLPAAAAAAVLECNLSCQLVLQLGRKDICRT